MPPAINQSSLGIRFTHPLKYKRCIKTVKYWINHWINDYFKICYSDRDFINIMKTTFVFNFDLNQAVKPCIDIPKIRSYQLKKIFRRGSKLRKTKELQKPE